MMRDRGTSIGLSVWTAAVAAMALFMATIGAGSAAADSSDCIDRTQGYRAGANNNPSSQATRDINGVKGIVDVPLTYNFRNVTSGEEMSVGDLYTQIEDDYEYDFVQFGWWYGYTDPAHGFETVIRPFMGEWNNGDEILQHDFTRTLTPGTSHWFTLRRNETATSPDYGKWVGFIDGTAIIKTKNAHLGGYVGSIGEVDWRCHGLRNSAVATNPDGSFAPTLQAQRRSTGLWYLWGEHYDYNNDPTCLHAGRYGTVGPSADDYSTFATGCPLS